MNVSVRARHYWAKLFYHNYLHLNDDGTFSETAPLPVVQLAANAHIEAQLASLAADRANATANTLAVVVAQLREEWDDLHLTMMPAISDEELVDAVKRALRELFA